MRRTGDAISAICPTGRTAKAVFRFEPMISLHPGQCPNPAGWPAKVADALKRPIVYENDEP
jgi:hypothetical protein